MSFYHGEPADDIDAPDDREYVLCDLCEKWTLDGDSDNGRIGSMYLCGDCYSVQESVLEGRGWALAADEKRDDE